MSHHTKLNIGEIMAIAADKQFPLVVSGAGADEEVERDVVVDTEESTTVSTKSSIESPTVSSTVAIHPLSSNWVLYAHLPHDTDWTIKSYIPIMNITSVEEAISLAEALPEEMIKNCMLFIMRGAITPMWEDTRNRHGGCFSYKVDGKNVKNIKRIWGELFYHLIGNTLSRDKAFMRNITGITISPKKGFCIIKIWMTNCDLQNPQYITEIDGLYKEGVIFKKHSPEY